MKRSSANIAHAVIDIGSNSIKLRVGGCVRGRLDVLLDTTEVVKLGCGFVDGAITEATMQNAVRVVAEMVDRARSLGAEPCLVGTMALRRAVNAGEFQRRIRELKGLDIRILSGEEEARYSWRGAMAGFCLGGDLVMFDTGGGSTEFVFGRREGISRTQSVPVGAVTLMEQFFTMDPVPAPILKDAMDFVYDVLEQNGIARARPASEPLVVGLGGGVVAVGSVKNGSDTFIPRRLHGMMLTQKDLAAQLELYSALTLSERQNIVGLPASRADIILGSVCIALCGMRALNVPSFILSINGLRHGLLMEMFEKDGCPLDGRLNTQG